MTGANIQKRVKGRKGERAKGRKGNLLFLPLGKNNMKRRRNISLFFVQLAMFVFMIHAIVPHCHHANGQVMFFFHNYYCEHVHSDHHHCDEACHHGSHFCHHHHAGDLDDDCVLTQPFVKGDEDPNAKHIVNVPTQDLLWAAYLVSNQHIDHNNNLFTRTGTPPEDISLPSHLFSSPTGLRAPPTI